MNRRRVSVFDVVVIMLVTLLTASLLTIQVVRSRHVARGASCERNLKQIGLAFHNYHATYKCLPKASGGTTSEGEEDPTQSNVGRLSALVGLTPFLEHQALWEQIANPYEVDGKLYPPMGPAPWTDPAEYPPWGNRPSVFVSSDDEGAVKHPLAASYVMNFGDGVIEVGTGPSVPVDRRAELIRRATQRGFFVQDTSPGFETFWMDCPTRS